MHSSSALGPAVGMVFAGKLTTIWVDYLDKGLEAPNNIDPSSKFGFRSSNTDSRILIV